MSKNLILNREFTKRNNYSNNYLQKQVHNSFLKDIRLSVFERQLIYQKICKYKCRDSVSRLKNYCLLTGHSRSVYRDVNLCRHKFNQEVLNGNIPGWYLGSW